VGLLAILALGAVAVFAFSKQAKAAAPTQPGVSGAGLQSITTAAFELATSITAARSEAVWQQWASEAAGFAEIAHMLSRSEDETLNRALAFQATLPEGERAKGLLLHMGAMAAKYSSSEGVADFERRVTIYETTGAVDFGEEGLTWLEEAGIVRGSVETALASGPIPWLASALTQTGGD
jgi:hypothetical protein